MSAGRLAPAVSERDHTAGGSATAVTLVEYGDYECPHCARAHPIVKRVQQRLGAGLRFVFRNFPLNEVHPHAERAAEAAEAAGRQDKFWEMHDLLFARQHRLDDDSLFAYAEELGLDAEAFSAALESGELEERVRGDFMSGVRSGVNGTPTFFIQGKRFDGEWDEEPVLCLRQ